MLLTAFFLLVGFVGGWWIGDRIRPKHADWQAHFALFPVYVDAWTEEERKDGKFSYLKWGWVDEQWYTWTDEYSDDRTEHAYWRYRLKR